MDYRCVDILEGALPEDALAGAQSRMEEFPLAPLLTTAATGQQQSSLALIKAMLLAGVAEGRPEGRVMTTLISGALNARKGGNWRRLMPPLIAANAPLAAVIDHCVEHVEAKLGTPKAHSDIEIRWLSALKRWCELLRAGAAHRRRPRPFIVGKPDVAVPEGPDDGPEPPPPLVIRIGVDDPPPVSPVEGTDDQEPPLSKLPEAPFTTLGARPASEGAPETIEAGEARRARTGFRTALENQFLPWSNRHLIADDCASLVAAIRKDLASEDPSQEDAAGLLGFAHVTGQLIEQAAEIRRTRAAERSYLSGRVYMRHVAAQPGAWGPDGDQQRLLRPHATHVPLLLPEEIADWLDRRFPTDSTTALYEALATTPVAARSSVRGWLTAAREASGGLQSLSRVEWWLAHALYQPSRANGQRADHVRPQLLCAVMDAQPCPSLYYRSYEVHEISALHREVLANVGWTMPKALVVEADGRRWVGSRLNLEMASVKAMWAQVTHHFESMVSDEQLPVHVRHNARELHECFSLIFQTLHRVVTDPFESLEFIDLQTGRMAIDDKTQGDARAHRFVPLPRLAVAQCEDQIEHVKRLVVAVAPKAPQTAHALMAMLEHPGWRTSPFRFLLNERLQIVRITPSRLIDEMESVFRLPLNLSRHFSSTWLLEHGVSDEALCSLLGHHDIGTQNLTILSPRDFDELYRTLIPLMDDLATRLDLRAIRTFLPPIATGTRPVRASGRPPEMSFGHKRREAARARQLEIIDKEVVKWIDDQLESRGSDKLTQDDVDALFERARKETANRRTYWASARFESMRAHLAEILRRHEDLKLDLPAVALSIKEVAHVCPMDGLAAAQWLQRIRDAVGEYWIGQLTRWRTAGTLHYLASPEALVLTLAVDSLVLDPAAWKCWLSSDRSLVPFADEEDRIWIRMPLPNRNSRLYPVRRQLGELLAGISRDEWAALTVERVVEFSAELSVPWHHGPGVKDFWQLLNRIQSGSAAQMPGLVLGFADGSHASVSPEDMCLERRSGHPPTLASLEAWHLQKPVSDEPELMAVPGVAPKPGKGQLNDVAEFRRRMAMALRTMDREAYAKKTPSERRRKTRPASRTVTMPDGEATTARGSGPLKRFMAAIDAQWDELVDSSEMAPACGLAVKWVHKLAKSVKTDGRPYAPKTIRNYWYSWALRVIEEFGPIHPRTISPAECEELYLQIVEDADVDNRQHLYAPMRSFHRYLVVDEGAPEIEWSELRQATGQGVTHVDANLVFRDEYLRALDLLRNDEAASLRVRAMQATVLVLVYRFGLRIAECLGLRAGDVRLHEDSQRWSVRVRGNQYRSLKTVSARRTVVALEDLSDVEREVLSGWSTHVEEFAASGEVGPLFGATAAGVHRVRLFPRRVIALRVAQALRIATGDPSVRIHHCRHSYATRILHVGLGLKFGPPSGKEVLGEHDRLVAQIRRTLTHESEPTRRLIWAIAVALGHSSPLTGLETYAHCGHEWLEEWCRRHLWCADDGKAAAVDIVAWSAGVTRRSMQRDLQRHAALGADERQQRAVRRWSRVRPLGVTQRAERELQLPPIRLAEVKNTLISADRIVDHARRFGRVDGLAQALFVTEDWIESVLHAANNFAAPHRTPRTPPGQWWLEGSDVEYAEHEGRQIDRALDALQKMEASALRAHCESIEGCLAPAARMIVIENADTLDHAWQLTKHLLDDDQNIQILLPAKLPRRLTPAERDLRDKEARRRAEAMGVAYRKDKPRLHHEHGIDAEGTEQLVQHARHLHIPVETHGRVRGSCEGTHNWLRPASRLGLRVKENATDLVRSSKVFTRILTSAIVAQKALKLTEARQADLSAD